MSASAVWVEIYRRMTLIKQNDERFRSVIKAGQIIGPYYSPRGQEAIPSAVSVNLTDEDYICTIYRGIHDMLAKGVPMAELWAEIAGKATGTCKGKGGPMHITHPASGVMVTTGIVGSFTNRSTWRRCGSCRCFLCVRTTVTGSTRATI
jgi:pyruvate dehydrogenase E1 component alpha subunit